MEDALAAVKYTREREISLKTAMEQAQRAYSSASNVRRGAIDFQTLLDTQNAQLVTEDEYAQATRAPDGGGQPIPRARGGWFFRRGRGILAGQGQPRGGRRRGGVVAERFIRNRILSWGISKALVDHYTSRKPAQVLRCPD
ncbi:MAG: hypothetical protein R3B51_05485 [Thermodesulfobacteriota bacterium]